MASKVNIKFVAILTGVVVVTAVGVLLAANKFMTKSAADHVKVAQAFEAASDFDKAAASYARAVNKSKGNPEFIKKWVECLEKITPKSAQDYSDRFTKEYIPALKALAESQPTSADAQKPVLDIILWQYRLFPPQPSTWEGFITQTDNVIRAFPEGDKAADPLRFYRGAARTNLASLAANTPAEALTKAKEDLEAALKADPSDARVMSMLCDWYRVASARARDARSVDEAERLTKELIERAGAFIGANKVNLPVLWTLTQVQILEENRATSGSRSMADQYAAHHPKIARLIEQVLSEPSDKVDPVLAYQVGAMAVGAAYPNALDEALKVIGHVLKAKPADVFLLSRIGELEMACGQYARALESLDIVAKMPDRPMSIEGMMLFGYRELALAQQADCTLVLYNKAADQAEKAKLLAQAKQYREQLSDKFGKTARLSLLDAKIKFCENDLVEARKLLTLYVEQNAGDLSARRLLADILARQGAGGAARQELEYVVQRAPADAESLVKMGVIEAGLGQFKEAQRHFEQVLAIDPGNQLVIDQIKKLKDMDAGDRSDNPVIKVLTQAQNMVAGTPPDSPGALAMVKKFVDDLDKGKIKGAALDDQTALPLARALVMLEDREGAKDLLRKAKAASKTPEPYERMIASIDSPNTVETTIAAINESPALSDLEKAMARYQAYRKDNRADDAVAELAKARAIDPENKLVIAASFDEALAKKDMAQARDLLEKAVKANIDKCGGRIFKFRIEQAEGNLAKAAAIAQEIIDADPLNALAHRMMGGIRHQMGMYNDALAGFEKALRIAPQEVENIKGKVRALVALKRLNEALLFLRDAKNFAAGDAEFADMLLTLEGEVGNIDFAIDRREKEMVRNPKNRTNQLELAAMLIKVQNFARAREVIDAIKKADSDFAAMQLDARWHARQGNMEKARDLWEAQIAKLKPEEVTLDLVVTYTTFLVDNGDAKSASAVLARYRDKQTPGVMQIDREMGDVAFHSGDWAGAVEAYSRALAGVTKDEGSLLRFRVIEATLRTKDFKGALDQCEKASASGVPDDIQLMLLRADACSGLGDFAGARKSLDRAVALDPNKAIGYFKRAEFLAQEYERLSRAPGAKPEQGEALMKDASTDLQTTLRIDPAFAPARKLLARINLGMRQPDAAIKLLQDGVAIDPDNGPVRSDLVQILQQLGKLNEALEVLNEGAKRSKDPNWNIMAAGLYDNKGEVDKVVEQYEIAWQKGVRSPALSRALMDARLRVAKPDLARIKQIVADPSTRTDEFAQLIMIRAKVARRENRLDDMEKDVRLALSKIDQASPASAAGFFQDLADVYPAKVKDMVAFVNTCKPAEGFSEPFRAQIIRYMLGEASLKEAGFADLKDLVATTKNKEAAVGAVRLLGDIMYAQKQFDICERIYEMYLQLRPDDADVKNNLAYVKSRYLKKHQEALPLAQAAAAALPDNPNVLDTLGLIQLELAQIGEAESTLLRAKDLAKVSDQQVPILVHLGQVAMAKGSRSKALDSLMEAERLMAVNPVLRSRFGDEHAEVKKKLDGAR